MNIPPAAIPDRNVLLWVDRLLIDFALYVLFFLPTLLKNNISFMKYYLTSFMIFVTIFTFAQQPKVNNIKEVKTLNIYGGNNKTIIGKLIINQTLQTKAFLINSYQTKDSLGVFTTIINIGNNENVPLFGGNFTLQFDHPIISVDGRCSGVNISTSIDSEKRNFSLKAGQINRPFDGNVLLSFEIKSTQKTLVTINGVDGLLKN